MADVTHLLDAAAAGDRKAAAALLPLVSEGWRHLAAARWAGEAPGPTLAPPPLVQEAFLGLGGDKQFAGGGHFFAAAAEARGGILVGAARRRNRQKRGGGRE